MFLENHSHLQQDIFGIEIHLSESKRKKLHNSLEASFYKLIFCNIDENFLLHFSLIPAVGQMHLLMY